MFDWLLLLLLLSSSLSSNCWTRDQAGLGFETSNPYSIGCISHRRSCSCLSIHPGTYAAIFIPLSRYLLLFRNTLAEAAMSSVPSSSATSSASGSTATTAPSSTTTTAPDAAGVNREKSKPYVVLWDLDSKTVETWLQSVSTLYQSIGGSKKGADATTTTTTSSQEPSTYRKRTAAYSFLGD